MLPTTGPSHGYIVLRNQTDYWPDEEKSSDSLTLKSNTKQENRSLTRTVCREFHTLKTRSNQVKDCDQVNQVEEKNFWSIGLGKSVEQLVEHQKMQPTSLYWETGLRTGNALKKKHMAGASRALWKLWTDFSNLRIENDLIKRWKRIDEFDNLTKIVIQRSLLNIILPFLHEQCGHFGMANTFDRVRERF